MLSNADQAAASATCPLPRTVCVLVSAPFRQSFCAGPCPRVGMFLLSVDIVTCFVLTLAGCSSLSCAAVYAFARAVASSEQPIKLFRQWRLDLCCNPIHLR